MTTEKNTVIDDTIELYNCIINASEDSKFTDQFESVYVVRFYDRFFVEKISNNYYDSKSYYIANRILNEEDDFEELFRVNGILGSSDVEQEEDRIDAFIAHYENFINFLEGLKNEKK